MNYITIQFPVFRRDKKSLPHIRDAVYKSFVYLYAITANKVKKLFVPISHNLVMR